MKKVAEICCGSLEDALNAQRAGADRIELNNAMYLLGLTPSVGTIKEVVKHCTIPVVIMVRPRPGGFFYNDYEYRTILSDIEEIIEYNIEGIAFGCIDENFGIDMIKSKGIVDMLHKANKEAVFHRAFDCVKDPYQSIEQLIDLGVNRVLTSGLKTTAVEGSDLLENLQLRYGDKIEILAGGGVNAVNASFLKNKTGILQYHSSCTSWRKDPTTTNNVSFGFAEPPHEQDYNIVDDTLAAEFVQAIKGL